MPKKLKPEKAADLQQNKPVKSSPARKTTAKEPEEGQHQDQEPAEGHKRQQKESLPAPSQKDMQHPAREKIVLLQQHLLVGS